MLAQLLEQRRARLPPQTDAFRWVDGELPDVTVDLFGDVAVLSLYREVPAAEEQRLASGLAAARPLRAVYVKRRPREARAVDEARAAPTQPLQGAPVEALLCHEAGLAFEIRPANGLSVGLYLDAREARAWVRRNARGRTVLNLFAYTCGFGVAARAGGATRAANVDASRKVLDWGARNLELNGFAADRFDLVSGDAFDWLGRFAKKGERFGLVVLDPPGFASTRESRFSAARDYHALVAAAAPVVEPGGLLLALCNVEALDEAAFEAQVRRGLGGCPFEIVERFGASAVDYRQPSTLKCLSLSLP